MLSRRTGLLVLSALAAGGILVVGCRSEGAATTGDGHEIIGGEVDTKVANDATVLVVRMSEGVALNTCTGTVVAPNLVLTARHCVSQTDKLSSCRIDGTAISGAAIRSDVAAGDLLVYTGSNAIREFANRTQAGARGTAIVHESVDVLCNSDVAFLVLDQDLETPVAPLRLDRGPDKAELLTAVGYGYTETGRARTRMRRENVPVLEVGPLTLGADRAGIGASEFQVGEVFCAGDSGGPAYSARGAVVGVVARGGNGTINEDNPELGCVGTKTRGVYTFLANKPDLVKKAFESAGAPPLLEEGRDAGAGLDAGGDSGPPDASASGSDAGSSKDASAPSVIKGPSGKNNGLACVESTECISKACFESVCRAQCVPGDCAFGWGCAKRGELRLCLQGSSDTDEQPAEEVETTQSRAPGPTKPVDAASADSGCSAGPRGTSTSALGLAGVAVALGAILSRRQRRRS